MTYYKTSVNVITRNITRITENVKGCYNPLFAIPATATNGRASF